jgi:hypothetical protein
MKEDSLFCFVLYCSYEIHRTGNASIGVLGVFGKCSTRRVHGLGSMAFGLAVQKFLNIVNQKKGSRGRSYLLQSCDHSEPTPTSAP